MESRCCAENAIFPLTDNERGACDAALHLSQHTKIDLMPNVHVNEKMELSGFHFESAGCDMANVLPVTNNLFDCIVAYEVNNDLHESFNDRVLHVLQNMQDYKTRLETVINELKSNTANVPAFSCMVDDNDDEVFNDDELVFTKSTCDRQVWDEQVPRKVGLYHAFVRPHTKDSIEHKLFIVVSGSLQFLDEEFHRLWQDCNGFTTCEQLLESEEIQWFRGATLRNHNRVAARIADALGLPVRCFIDTEDPTGHRRSAHPTTMTMKSDIDMDLNNRRVHVVDGGCFLHKSSNGVLFEMHASEGFWLFTGPPDHATYNTYGTIFNFQKDMTCFPTSTLRYHDKFPARGTVVCTLHGGRQAKDTIFERTEVTPVETLFPDENFMRKLEALGFNRNNAIVSLMPLLTYISEKSI
jgi:hypothetical protein